MNAEEDDIFSDSFETPEDKNDPDFCPTNTPDMSEQSSEEYSQNSQVWAWKSVNCHMLTVVFV